jgi:hypothetical protein
LRVSGFVFVLQSILITLFFLLIFFSEWKWQWKRVAWLEKREPGAGAAPRERKREERECLGVWGEGGGINRRVGRDFLGIYEMWTNFVGNRKESCRVKGSKRVWVRRPFWKNQSKLYSDIRKYGGPAQVFFLRNLKRFFKFLFKITFLYF